MKIKILDDDEDTMYIKLLDRGYGTKQTIYISSKIMYLGEWYVEDYKEKIDDVIVYGKTQKYRLKPLWIQKNATEKEKNYVRKQIDKMTINSI